MNRGFTLFETMIYIALFGVIITAAICSVYSLSETSAKYRNTLAVEQEGSFIVQKISWVLMGADSITVPNTTTLSVQKNSTGDLYLFTLSGTTLFFSKNGGTTYPLNRDHYPVRDLHFSKTFQNGNFPASVLTVFSIHDRTFTSKKYLFK